MSFIDSHREELGIEPICRELAIAPSSYHEHASRLADPAKRSARARRDDEIKQQIKRVHDDSSGLYGTRKVWHQMRREGATVAKCTIERLMRAMGLAGVRRGKTCVTTVSNPKPRDSRRRHHDEGTRCARSQLLLPQMRRNVGFPQACEAQTGQRNLIRLERLPPTGSKTPVSPAPSAAADDVGREAAAPSGGKRSHQEILNSLVRSSSVATRNAPPGMG